MAQQMSKERALQFIAEGTRTGKLATVRADGRPHVAPIWFVVDGDDILFNTGAETVKGRNLRHDSRAALSVDLEQPPYAFVTIEGTVTLDTDTEAMLPISVALARRYMGDELAEEFGRRNAVEGELLVRLHADKILGFDDLTA